MYTDDLLIARAARELDGLLSGARLRDAGTLADGRLALQLWKRGMERALCVDLFARTPLVTLETVELPIAPDYGFVRALSGALRATTLLSVRARAGDRLLRLEFGARSRFGVESGYALILELIPRFGNAVLLKGETVVAAAKTFSPAENATRAIEPGARYVLPPFDAASAIPRVIAASYAPAEAAKVAERLRTAAAALGPVYAYRDERGALVQAHLVPLDQYSLLRCERSDALLPLLRESRESALASDSGERTSKRRRDLAKALSARETKALAESEKLEAKMRATQERETLREQGDGIYAAMHELAPHEREEAKARAAELFARYKKLGLSQGHLAHRRANLESLLESLAALQWELARAGDDDLDDVDAAVAQLLRRQPGAQRARTAAKRARKPLQYAGAHGSRILVGRTPIENADLTFRVARPNDLWFHVRGQPGAHVILQRDDRANPSPEEIVQAAGLAALHSKAKTSPKVTVDYTERKHVRKRPAAAPGLVFYTGARSIHVEPGAAGDATSDELHKPAS